MRGVIIQVVKTNMRQTGVSTAMANVHIAIHAIAMFSVVDQLTYPERSKKTCIHCTCKPGSIMEDLSLVVEIATYRPMYLATVFLRISNADPPSLCSENLSELLGLNPYVAQRVYLQIEKREKQPQME